MFCVRRFIRSIPIENMPNVNFIYTHAIAVFGGMRYTNSRGAQPYSRFRLDEIQEL
jgi:hypothetical protein